MRLGPGGTASAILTLTDKFTRQQHVITTADIAAARAVLPHNLPDDEEIHGFRIDALIQQAALGAVRSPHPRDVINMDRITDLVTAAGIPAYVEHTGGGCATIIVGAGQRPATDDGESMHDAILLAGPGWFDWDADTRPVPAYALRGDFYVGPDDLGESTPWTPPINGTRAQAEDAIAAHIVATVKAFTQLTQ